MAKLHLNLKGEYFDQIKAGEKVYEYRLQTAYWAKRLAGRTSFDVLVIKRGYPKAGDVSRIFERPWRGFVRQVITHPHFGPKPVAVFAIRVNGI